MATLTSDEEFTRKLFEYDTNVVENFHRHIDAGMTADMAFIVVVSVLATHVDKSAMQAVKDVVEEYWRIEDERVAELCEKINAR